MNCSKCGTKIECTYPFCSSCGEKQDVQKNLIMAAMNKDELAYTELFGQAEHTVKLTVYSIMNPNGSNSADADDVILDSMMKGFGSLDQLKDANRFLPWMRTIARNKAIDYLRKNKELNFSDLSNDEMNFEDTLEDMDFSKRPDMVIDQNAKTDLLKEILSDIPADQRAVIVMYYYNDMKIPEIARELGCTEATVKSRLKYGKSKVKTGVNELQKKHGIKLYSISPVLVLYWLFRDTETAYTCGTNMLESVLHNSGISLVNGQVAVESVSNAVKATNTASSVSSTAKATASAVKSGVTAKAVAATAVKGVSVKMVSAIVVTTIVATSGVGYGIYTMTNQNAVSTDAVIEDYTSSDEIELEFESEVSSVETSSESSSESSVESNSDSSVEGSSETSSESTMSTAEQLGIEGEMLGSLVFQYENMINGFGTMTRTQYIKDMNEVFGVTLEQALKITEEEGGVDILYNVDRIETPEEFYVGLAAEVGVEITYNPNKEETDFQEVYYDCAGDPTLKIENLGDGKYRVELSIYRHIGFDPVEAQIVDGNLAFTAGWDDGETWNIYLVKTEDGSIDAHCKYSGYNYSNKFYEHFVIYHFSKTEDFEGEFCKYIYPVYE